MRTGWVVATEITFSAETATPVNMAGSKQLAYWTGRGADGKADVVFAPGAALLFASEKDADRAIRGLVGPELDNSNGWRALEVVFLTA